MCRQAGMNDHVSKPIDPDAMFATVMKWIKPRHARLSEPPAQKVEAASPQNLPDLPEIDGVDIKDGLKRVGGNSRLYRDLLMKFAAKYSDAGLQITDALHIGDRNTAERIAHTVKGVAGNIGIKPVQFAAEKLEKAIRESDSAAPTMLQDFTSALRTQIDAIEQALPWKHSHSKSNRRKASIPSRLHMKSHDYGANSRPVRAIRRRRFVLCEVFSLDKSRRRDWMHSVQT